MSTKLNFKMPGASAETVEAMQKKLDEQAKEWPARKRAEGYPWIVMNANHGGRFECRRCGGTYEFLRDPITKADRPQPVWAVNALSRGFEKEHRRCKPHPEGDTCAFCGGRHDSEKCTRPKERSVAEWRAGPDVGLSSATIAHVLEGTTLLSRATVPMDPSDFGRCHRLLQLFPWMRPRLHEVAERFPEWKPLVYAWDELTALYEEELQRPDHRAPKLYARMRELNGEKP